MEDRSYKIICAALLAGIIACAAIIAWLLLRPEPRAQVFTDAVLVREGLIHGPL